MQQLQREALMPGNGGHTFLMPNSVVLVYVILLVYSSTFAQVGERGNARWVSPRPDADYRLDGYEVTERFCSDGSGNLCVYLKRDGDKEILFYIHHRQIVVTLGHHRRLVLINDWEATKSGKVVIANLSLGTTKQIDRQALGMYRRRVSPDRRLWIVAEAYEFSPDDRQVLIKMVKEDVSAATAEESRLASKTYRERWYAVDSRSGKVVREYQTAKVPRKWWELKRNHPPFFAPYRRSLASLGVRRFWSRLEPINIRSPDGAKRVVGG